MRKCTCTKSGRIYVQPVQANTPLKRLESSVWPLGSPARHLPPRQLGGRLLLLCLSESAFFLYLSLSLSVFVSIFIFVFIFVFVSAQRLDGPCGLVD